ncbi:hypothetical protein [Embleya sp. NPDC059259]|uniref:hypothetical protein n=1 Tax=unclassified Embleya TaxID=2699296 RepID=UPI0036B4D8C9
MLSPADGAPVTYVEIVTTSLDERHRRPWEIALIRHHRGIETEHVFLIDDVDRALTVGRLPRPPPPGQRRRAPGRAVEDVFGPWKVNYETLGNALPHLHTHVIPRHRDDPAPGARCRGTGWTRRRSAARRSSRRMWNGLRRAWKA